MNCKKGLLPYTLGPFFDNPQKKISYRMTFYSYVYMEIKKLVLGEFLYYIIKRMHHSYNKELFLNPEKKCIIMNTKNIYRMIYSYNLNIIFFSIRSPFKQC